MYYWMERKERGPVACMCEDGIMLVTMLEFIRRISVRRQNTGIPVSIDRAPIEKICLNSLQATDKTIPEPRFEGTRTRKCWLAFLSDLTFLELTSIAMERKLPSTLPKSFRIWSAGPAAFPGCCPTSINGSAHPKSRGHQSMST